ncbi:MAG: RHS repeat protein [Sphingobacteriaceae bacterium]|nr:RHS repeat protein [Cytophagaceae bacterium]
MNHPFFIRLCLLLLVSLGTACSNRETAPQGECRIQSSTTTSTSSVSTFNERTTYEYDASGNLLSKITTNQSRYLDAQIANRANRDQTTTNRYTYNAEGYLLTSAYQFKDNYFTIDGKPATEEFVYNLTYTYANGRLSGYLQQYVINGKALSPSPNTYDYDAAGNLLRLTRGNSTWTFSQNRLVDYVEKTGSAENRPYVIDNGLVTSYTIPGGLRSVYTYDGQRRLTKMEEYVNDRLQSYYTQTYGDGKLATAAEPPFKGFPVVAFPSTSPNSDRQFFEEPGVLTGKKQYYITNSQTGQEQFFSEMTISHQLNAQGFVVSAARQVQFKHPSTLPQVENATMTYSYTGCN